jgi:ferric-dicitrate binding protein FerR (iron transport regulator)
LSKNSTEEENKQVLDWLEKNEENRKLFTQLKKIHLEIRLNLDNSIDLDKAYGRFLLRVNNSEERIKKSQGKTRMLLIRLLKYAAILIIIPLIGLAAYYIGKDSHPLTAGGNLEINVPYGGKSSVILPDGSNIWLNAGSRLRYDRNFNLKTREVFLEGEALFNVKKNNIPFIVHTSHLDIHVTGTIFNVKSYPEDNEIETTLIEGNIQVVTEGNKKPINIEPNQMLCYRKKLDASELVPVLKEKTSTIKNAEVIPDNITLIYKDVDIRDAVSWRSGALYIENETLESLVKKLERKFDVTFKFRDEELKNYSYSGTLLDLPLEQVLRALKITSPVDYEISEKTVSLSFNRNFNRENRK